MEVQPLNNNEPKRTKRLKCPFGLDCASWRVISSGRLVCWCRNYHEPFHYYNWKVLWKVGQDCKLLLSKLPKVLFMVVLTYMFDNELFIPCVSEGECSELEEDCFCDKRFLTNTLYLHCIAPSTKMFRCHAPIFNETGCVDTLYVYYPPKGRPLIFPRLPQNRFILYRLCRYKFN